MNQLLEKFQAHLNICRQYEQVLSLLYWDLQTICPKNGVDGKVNAISYFSGEIFRLSTSKEYGEMLEALSRPEVFDTLDEAMQVTVKRYTKNYRRFCRIPEDFYTEFAAVRARSEKAWEEAKTKKDFAVFAPHLEKVIEMTIQSLQYEEPDKDPYEVLLEDHEAGMDSASIDKLFEELKEGLVPLLGQITAAPRPDTSALAGRYDIQAQKQVERLLLEYIGFDFESGTTGETEHPFTTGIGPNDIRVTNHFSEEDPINAMFSAIHEGGHGIFEQNVAPELLNTAAGEINLMGLHESQSRFFENILGRRKSFWVPIYDKIGAYLPQFKEIDLDTFYAAINDVHASMIRTDADEVTYCLHIILRYEMERAIFYDKVPVDKLPTLWNDKMEALLGIRPSNDAEGILQDTHWAGGMFGYFPSYLLGSIYDGMLLQQLQKDLGDIDALLARGEILQITRWLNKNIHRNGSLYTSREVLGRLCGCEISAKPLLDYFTKKYTEIYHL